LVDCDKFWGCKHISAGYTEMMKKWISNWILSIKTWVGLLFS
jgi:hypothetical protein